MILDRPDVDVLYLEDGDVYRPTLENKTTTMFFLKKTFSSFEETGAISILSGKFNILG